MPIGEPSMPDDVRKAFDAFIETLPMRDDCHGVEIVVWYSGNDGAWKWVR